jgi:UDP-N-acetylglucosamine transferase subunit ALG13
MMAALDDIAGRNNLEIVAQTCDENYQPRHMTAKAQLHPDEFARLFKSASMVVAHAGIGTILSAKQHQKPLILMPRKASLGEHRNEHQAATAQQIKGRKGLYIADTADELEGFLRRTDLIAADNAPSATRQSLVEFLRTYIDQ